MGAGGAPDAGPVPPALIGRDAELARLADALAGDRWVAVVGEAGIGKTSLIRAAIVRSGRVALEGGGFATLSWMPYLALRRALGIEVAGDAARSASIVEARVGPDLLVLDDLQWADPATLATLELLAGRIQIVAAVRSGDAGAEAAIAVLDRAGSLRIDLEGLSDSSATTLLRRVRSDLGATAASHMIDRAGGNPLLLEEMARSGETVAVVGRLLEARRERLSSEARATLDLLAVAERPLRGTALRGVEELLETGLVRRRDGDVEIRHALLGEAIRGRLGVGELISIEGRLGAMAGDPAEQARHLLAAGKREEAAAVARAAMDGVSDPRTLAVLLTAVADATWRLEDRVRATTELVALSDFPTIIRLTEGELPAEGDIGLEARFQRANALYRVGAADDAWALVTASIAGVEDRDASAFARLLMLVVILTINHKGEPASALEFLERELERGGLEPSGTANLTYFREAIRLWTGETGDIAVIRRAVEDSFEDRHADVAGRTANLVKLLRAGEGPASALEVGLEMHGRLTALGYEMPAIDILVEAAEDATMAGDYARAIAIADTVLDRPTPIRARIYAVARSAIAAAYLGQFDVAALRLKGQDQPLHGDRSETAEILIAEIEVAYWSGEPARAVAVADELVAHGSSSPVNLTMPLLTAAWADLDLGRPIREVPTFALPALASVEPTLVGIRALAAADPSAAVEPFDRAASLAASFFAANAMQDRWAAAEALRRSGDVAPAIDRLREVERAAEAAGFEPLLARIRRSLRLCGVRVTAARQAGGPRVGLTPREREVARLVGDGLNNIEIARRLGLGRPTVARMISSAMAKLGVERRTQLAAHELV